MTKKRSRKRPIVGAGAIPAIFVKVRSNQGYLGYEYKHASIQVRRAKYRYLVWYEGRRKHEFYLGAVKAVPLTRRSAAPERPRPGVARRRDIVGAGK